METKMENDMEALGPFKGYIGTIVLEKSIAIVIVVVFGILTGNLKACATIGVTYCCQSRRHGYVISDFHGVIAVRRTQDPQP